MESKKVEKKLFAETSDLLDTFQVVDPAGQ